MRCLPTTSQSSRRRPCSQPARKDGDPLRDTDRPDCAENGTYPWPRTLDPSPSGLPRIRGDRRRRSRLHSTSMPSCSVARAGPASARSAGSHAPEKPVAATPCSLRCNTANGDTPMHLLHEIEKALGRTLDLAKCTVRIRGGRIAPPACLDRTLPPASKSRPPGPGTGLSRRWLPRGPIASRQAATAVTEKSLDRNVAVITLARRKQAI
jgi:hypothetical protein